MKLRWAIAGVGLVLMLAGPFLLILAWPEPSCSSDTVVRASSPSGHIEAVLDENGCGATTSFGYVVSLKPVASSMANGVRVASAYGAVRNDDAYGMNLVWVDENTLEVQYWKAQWVTLEAPDVSVDGTSITTSHEGRCAR